jgi:hypothetical protein
MKPVAILSFILILFATGCSVRPASADDPEIVEERTRLQGVVAQEAEAARVALRAKQSANDTVSVAAWTQFRETFPYHIQEIAVSEPYGDGSRTIIVSEPPPAVSMDDILKAVGPALVSYSVQSQDVATTAGSVTRCFASQATRTRSWVSPAA